ncbi:MAG: hypothetical protein H0W83_11230, partial [Planctomycetes bacterium]|nr:hypothetical protein [Planctomycetota bacterium]
MPLKHVLAWWAAVLVVLGLLAMQVDIKTDLRAMLPRNDPEFTREMDFFARQGAAKLMAIEAAVPADVSIDRAAHWLREIQPRLESLGLRSLTTSDPSALVKAADIIREHIPVLTTPDDLAALAPDLSVERLTERLRALRERASQPEDMFVGTLSRSDVLGLMGRPLLVLRSGLGGSRTDGSLLIHSDEHHALLVMEVPFDPSEMVQTRLLMDTIDAAAARARSDGVVLEGIGAYRHFRENIDSVQHDISSSMPISIVLIALLLYSLIPNIRALIVMQVPALLGMVGSIAAVVATGQSLPAPLLGFGAAILGVAVDYGQHVVVGIRAGHVSSMRKPLLMAFMTTTTAFAVLFTSSVPGLRCIATMVIGGLAMSLLSALFLVPRLTPTLTRKDPWLVISRPLLRWTQRFPRTNWLIALALTIACIPGLKMTHFNEELRKYDGSRPESWKVLEEFQDRWGGEYRSSDFLVSIGADLDAALDHVATARRTLGLPAKEIELLLPSRAEQRRRLEGWNAFWNDLAPSFAANLETAAQANHMRFAAFAASLACYQPTATVPELTFQTWSGTPVGKLLGSYVAPVDEGWQVASPLGKLTKPERAATKAALAGGDVWLAGREHIGTHLVEVVQSDLAKRGLAILAAILVLVFLIERDWRVVAAQLLPSLLALAWTFGLLGWCGV